MKKIISLTLILCAYLPMHAQENTSFTKKEKPISIYTANYKDFIDDSNSFKIINDRLKLMRIDFRDIDFILVDSEDIDDGIFSIPFKNLRKVPSSYIYDDYTDYRDYNFLKGFLKENDPTRWEPCRFLAPGSRME